MKILFAASECTPFVKTGGLADVVGSLPAALSELGVDVRVVLPKYGSISAQYTDEAELIEEFTVPVGWRNQYCGVEQLELEGVTFYFLDNRYYFDRYGIYGHYDDGERFSYFSRSVLEMLSYLDYVPDIIHCHDWQTGLVPALKRAHYGHYPDIKTVFTIHNLKYQGIFPPEVLGEIVDLGYEYFTPEGLEYYGNVNYLKAGLNYADIITTVSKTYANEIQNPEYGEGLEGVLRSRSYALYGIVNGINYNVYDPETDRHLFVNYRDSLRNKRENKLKLQKMLGLPASRKKPMLIMITRLVEQKGLDLVKHVLDEILQNDLQMVVLGTGEERYEQFFRAAGHRYPEKLSANITFDTDLAHKMYAAGDMFLMPSRFEPCGIGQLISFRYLTVPIVRETGGLVDTVIPYNEETGEGNGFSFSNYNAHDMLYTIERALQLYNSREIRDRIHENILKGDYSWKSSAEEYNQLYQELL